MKVDMGGDYTRLSLKDTWKIENEQILVVGKSGSGKTVTMLGIAEELHNLGYIVIILTDYKDVVEFGFAMFEPEDPIHLANLKAIGKKPSKKEVILYHPFTFNLPKTPSPDMRVFTFNIKSLIAEELALLIETHSESDTIRVLKDGLNTLKNDETIYDFLYKIQEKIEGNTAKYKGKVITEGKASNFFLTKSTPATSKNIGEIGSYFTPFIEHHFFAPENGTLNLDVEEEIFNHQEKYHVLITKHIPYGEEKIKSLVILKFLNEIISKAKGEKCKHPIAFLIDEIGNLCPYKSEGFREFLANAIRPKITTIRSGVARGGTSILGTQVLTNVDEKISESATITLFGQMNSNKDIIHLKKAWNYNKDTIDTITSLKRGRFILRGEEEIGAFRMFFPSHMHKEERYNFLEKYRKYYPFKLKNYSGLMKEMNKFVKLSEDKVRDKVNHKKKEEMQSIDEAIKSKATTGGAIQELEKVKGQRDELKQKTKLDIKKRCYELFTTNDPKLSYRQIGEQLSLHHATVKSYIQEYQKGIIEKVAIPEKASIPDKVAIPERVTKPDAKICPKCGGNIAQEEGKYGSFYVCSNFPKCRYTFKPENG